MVLQKRMVSRKIVVALAVLCVAALIGLNVSIYTYWQETVAAQDKDAQILSLQSQLTSPKLVSIDLKYTDNRTASPFLHVYGYVVNVGNVKANNCTIHVNGIQNGNATAIDTTANIEPVDAGIYRLIDMQFPYTGQPLVAYNTYLEWTT